jgi:hypothetical protein
MIKHLLFALLLVGLAGSVYAQSKPKVLLVAAESTLARRNDVVNKLTATGSFSTVDIFEANIATPTVANLQAYDVVLVWSNNSFFEPIVLGDNLATYLEGGGHVINMVFSFNGGDNTPGGAFASNYQLIQTGGFSFGTTTILGTINVPLHPLANNITNFSGGTSSYRSTGTVVNGDVIAEWSDGLPLIVAQENVGPALSRRVDLNFYPVSSDVSGSFWDATTQGTEIIENAIIWASDPFRKVIVGEIATDIGQSYDAAWADYDNDGFQDLFVPDRDVTNSDKLYHNNGDGTFTAVVAGDLGTDADVSFGAVWGDYDNDGDQDLFVAVGGSLNTNSNRLYRNNGDGTFSSIIAGDLGADALGAFGGAWADYDNDGFLDLAVGNSSAAASLYHNNGNGTFSLNPNFTPSDVGNLWSVDWGDFNGDLRSDLYVTNNGGTNFLYRNDGGGFFTKETVGPHVTDSQNNFGASWIDIDNDGDNDIFVPVNAFNNALYINDGSGGFTSNLTSAIVTETSNSWSASWADYDNDGKKDLYIGSEYSPGVLFRSTGGTNFVKAVSTIVSKDEVVNGSGTIASSWCDVDNDGDVDLFTSVFNGENNFYINEINNGNNWINIELEGTVSNRSAIGAKIKLTNTNGASSYHTITTQNGRGQSSLNVTMGLGSYDIRDILITWPSGLAQSVKASNNQFINVVEGAVDDRPAVLVVAATGTDIWATDVRDKLIETGQFSVVGLFRAESATPSLAELQSYDAVLVWSENSFANTTTIGDNLADYIDGGGAVITGHFSLNTSLAIGGRLATDYQLIAPGATTTGNVILGTINFPDHPIMNKVSSFDGGVSSFRSNGAVVSGTVIAEWSDGLPLIVVQENVGPAATKRVDLNFWPTSADGYPSNWVSTTDGTRIMANAILWTLSPTDQFTKLTGTALTADLAGSLSNAWGDYDGNGHLDLFVGNQPQADFLYKNNGNGTFTKNITDASVLPISNTYTPTWGDFDNDGNLDLFVPNFGGNNILYRNNGAGALVEAINFGDMDNSFTGAWGDYDGDGFIDLFVGNSGNNRLYRNNQDGTFTEIIDTEITNSLGNSFGASWADYDDDGFLDLFITELGFENILLHNNGNNTFTRIISGEIVTDLNSSLGASWGDYDNDADLDLFVSNYSGENNVLYQNNGNGTFTKILNQNIVLDASSSVGSSWEDFDNDGYLDLFVATDNFANDLLYQNNGDGTFTSIKLWAPTTDAKGSFGSSWADYDKDGDVDLFVTVDNPAEPNLFYQNNGNSNNWINIVLEGVESNRSAIGAKVYITTSDGTQFREVASQTGFGSQNSLNVEFGLASATVIDLIEINWPSGRNQFLFNVNGNQFITIVEDVISPIAFTVGSVITTGGNVIGSIWNSTNTGVDVTVPIDNDISLDGGTLQVMARVDANTPENIGVLTNLVAVELGTSKTVSLTAVQLEALTGFAEGSVVTFNAIISDVNGNLPTTGTASATTLVVDQISTSAFTVGTVVTTGGTAIGSIWNSTNTGVGVTVPVNNDISLDGGTLQVTAQVDANTPENIGASINLVTANLGATITVSFTAAELEALTGFAEGSAITFNVIINDVYGNPPTTGTASATTLAVDQISTTALTVGAVVTTGGTVISSIWNSTNTGVDVTVPINNDTSIDGGTLQVTAQINANTPENLGAPINLVAADLGTSKTVSFTAAQLEALTGFAEGSVITFNAAIADVNGNPPTMGTASATTLVVDQVPISIVDESFPTYYDINGGTQQASITISGALGTQTVEVEYGLVTKPVADITTVTATTTDNITYSFDLGILKTLGEPLGVGYIFRITENNQTTSSNVGVTHVEFLGASSPTIPNLKFGNKVTDYQIIAIPLELNNNSVSAVFEDDLGAYDDTKWRLFHYQGSSNIEKKTGTFEPGEGYWLIARNSTAIDVGAGSVPQATKADPYQISLSSGWNQIGNPYNFNISWSEVLAFNGNPAGVDATLSLYENGFVSGDVLDKARGAFVNASSNITLNIPVIKNNSIQGRKGGNNGKTSPIDADNWMVALNLKGDNLVYQLGGFGMNAKALLGKDKNDLYTVPRFIEYLEINFARDEFSNDSPLTLDVVPTADNFVWNFTVNSNLEGEQLTLEWDNSYWGNSEKQLILFDEISNTRIDMHQQTEYRYAYTSERKFQLVFGDTNFIEGNLIPKSITINKAFPNPFSEHLSIPVGLPENSGVYQVRLEIYDQMGRIISQNTYGEMPSGYHIIQWDGTNNQGSKVTKGIYHLHLILTKDGKSENHSQRIYYK